MYRRLKVIWLPKRPGRPPVSEPIVDLILDMKRSNWGWGALKISNELKAMGINVSKTTVAKILRDNGMLPPKTRYTPPSWRACANWLKGYLAMDFTYIFDSSGRQLFIFNVIDCASRRLLVCCPTYEPTRDWIIQQLRNCMMEYGFDWEPPVGMIHDNDGLFKGWLGGVLAEFSLKSCPITPHCPWENGIVERFHHTLKTEVLARLSVLDNMHAMELCELFRIYYNTNRTHQGINGNIPDGTFSRKQDVKADFSYKKQSTVNGLVTHFSIAA